MLGATLEKLKTGGLPDRKTTNALIESFCIHARNLNEFFLENRKEDTLKGTAPVEALTRLCSKHESSIAAQVTREPVRKDASLDHLAALITEVYRSVRSLHRRTSQQLGPVRFEWVFDGNVVWIVQLHRGATQSTATILVPGEAERWVPFEVSRGLEELRSMIELLEPGAGLILDGEVGLTSHIADVIRRAGIPARFKYQPEQIGEAKLPRRNHVSLF